jgi:AraC-like DNA-binding protein
LYLRRPACAPLDAFVECLWASERGALAHARERVLPGGRDSLVIALHDAALRRYADEHDREGQTLGHALWQGVHDRPVLRDTSAPACVVGVSFRPGGAAALAGVPMHELADRTIELGALWGFVPVASLRERLLHTPQPAARLDLLEAWLLRRLAHMQLATDPVVAQALQFFTAQPASASVDGARRATGCSPQRFIERFRAGVGLTPKRYARVLRFHALLQPLADRQRPALAELALDAGYADQAHLAREFRRLGGLTAGEYRAVDDQRLTHVALESPR